MKQYGPGHANTLEITPDGYLVNADFSTQVVLGNANGYSYQEKFGNNPSIPSKDVLADVWDGSGVYPWPAAGTATTIQSSSINDDSVGSGAQQIKVFGLDNDYAEINETVVMDGTNAVTLSNEYLRVYRAYVLDVGATETNAGTINIQHGATVIGRVQPGFGQTLMAVYTIPAGFTGYVYSYYISSQRGVTTGGVDATFRSRNINEGWRVRHQTTVQNVGTSHLSHYFIFPPSLPEKTDVRLSVTTSVNAMSVDGGFEMLLKAN